MSAARCYKSLFPFLLSPSAVRHVTYNIDVQYIDVQYSGSPQRETWSKSTTKVVTNHPFSSSVVVSSCLLGVVVVEGAQPRPSMNRKFHPGFQEVRSLSDWMLHGMMA